MSARRKRVLLALLLGSAGLNAYLLYAEARPNAGAGRETTPGDKSVRDKSAPLPWARDPLPRVFETWPCPVRIAHLEKRIEELEEDIFEHLDIRERFEKSAPLPTPKGLERAMARLFSRPEFQAIQHRLECRGKVCWLELLWSADAEVGDYMRAVQSGALVSWVRVIAWGHDPPASANWSDDDPRKGESVYLGLVDELPLEEEALLERIAKDFLRSRAIAECAAGNQTTGQMTVGLVIFGGIKSIEVNHAPGPLADSRTGQCILDRLRALASAASVPDNARHAVYAFEIAVP